MSLHKFGYSSEQLKLRQDQDLKGMIKSHKKLAQMTHSKLKEDFENDLKNLSEDLEKVIEEIILASILEAELSEQFQDNLLDSKLKKIYLFLVFRPSKNHQ